MLALRGRVFTPSEESDTVVIDGDRVVAVGGPVPPGAEVIEAEIVAPGFIDLQINGAFGIDILSEPGRLGELARQLPRTGVTAFLPTLVSAAHYPVLDPEVAPGAARPLGIHYEGPFLGRAGAHDPAALRPPRDEPFLASARLVTLAPELPGALALIETLAARGVSVAVGHTGATFDQARAAIEAGARIATHLFNAMTPLHHRAPGAAAAFLLDPRCTSTLICDGAHVHPAVVELASRCGRIVLVTDSVAPRLAGRDLRLEGGAYRLADGTLAGSALTMDQAVRNYRRFTGCGIAEALAAATLAPALALGLAHHGRLQPGAAADVVLLDAELRVQGAYVGGVRSPA